ncbi:MAG: hypothetical protein JSU70_12045 [Phycisphaerales bacterium]|nr:MAG: hypothetical protein JSU70_12045 [Phycisphaerales bacterium]
MPDWGTLSTLLGLGSSALRSRSQVHLCEKTFVPTRLLALLIVCCIALPAQAKYGGGSGTSAAPYLIYTAEQMNEIGANANDWAKHFKLMADIDLSQYTGTDFNLIGYWRTWEDTKPFMGVFDGNGHTISHFTYGSVEQDYVGLFAYASGLIKNLGLIGPNVTAGGNYVGSLVGYFDDGSVTGCYAKDANVSGNRYVGGLIGLGVGSISECHSGGSVSGEAYVGGLVGLLDLASLGRCYSAASVSGNDIVGGLIGKTAHDDTTVTYCYATGSVTGYRYVGGLAALVERGAVYKCYSVGTVLGHLYTGGLAGERKVLGQIRQSFWDTETSGQATSAGGTGKTTTQMQSIDTFFDAGWDFVLTWDICEGTNYPVLRWQIPIGDLRCPDGVNMIDFSRFAQRWLDSFCSPANDYCGGIDLDASGHVGFDDLSILTDNWLEGIRY